MVRGYEGTTVLGYYGSTYDTTMLLQAGGTRRMCRVQQRRTNDQRSL